MSKAIVRIKTIAKKEVVEFARRLAHNRSNYYHPNPNVSDIICFISFTSGI